MNSKKHNNQSSDFFKTKIIIEVFADTKRQLLKNLFHQNYVLNIDENDMNIWLPTL
jgi:hypothetical protein